MTQRTAAPETPFWLEINGHPRTCWTCTPQDLDALVMGYLFTAGYIRHAEELETLQLVHEPTGCIGAVVSVPEKHVTQVTAEQRRIREHGCGVLHYVNCEPAQWSRPTQPLPDADTLRLGFRTLFALTDEAHPHGGMHGAALMIAGALRCTAFDVGRHNAVDRVIGMTLREGIDPARGGLLLSARVSGAMALKAARAGVAYVASRSLPTTLAQQFADAVELPLIARAGRGISRESPA